MQKRNEAVSLAIWSHHRDHPVAFYRHQLEAYGRLHYDGKRMLVADYELIEQMVADEAQFSDGPVRAWPAHTPDPLLRIVEQQAHFLNGAEHRRVQALMHAPLSRLVQSGSHLLDYMQHTVTCLLDAVQQKGEMDAVRDFAAPLSLLVMARALGIPTARDDHLLQVMEASDAFADVTSGSIQGHGQKELRCAFAALLRRFPDLRLKPGSGPTVHPNVNIGGLTSLSVCWGTGPILPGGGE